jgi:hypothetical protein
MYGYRVLSGPAWATGARGRRNYLDSDDLLLFARGDGHILSMLVNSAFALLGLSSRPIRPMADWNHELGYWLRGTLKLWIQHNRGARQIRTPNLGIC